MKISVIVPIYQVEQYLEQCLDSIINQTYKDLEIILVDDGSKDNCATIMDLYAKKDTRIKVYHKENGGLSSARNYGILKSSGDLIAFIDSDDYIHPKMLEILHNDLVTHNADISCCSYLKFTDIVTTDIESFDNNVTLFNNKDAIKEMYSSNSFGWNSWNKLYKSSLFDTIKFPEGRICEDKSTTYKLFYNSVSITYNNKKLYYYRVRENSIMGIKNKKYYMDTLLANDEMKHFFECKNELRLYEYASCYAVKNCFLIYSSLYKKEEYNDILMLCNNEFVNNYKYILKGSFLNYLVKIYIYIFCLNIKHKRYKIANTLISIFNKIWR